MCDFLRQVTLKLNYIKLPVIICILWCPNCKDISQVQPYYKYEVENTDQCFNLLPNCECKGNFVGSSDTNLLSDTNCCE
jgi:hypothetical protein